MSQITETLRTRRQCSFFTLFDDARTTYDVVVTFLAILEMAKMRITRIYQSDVNEDIHLEYRVMDDDAGRDAEAIEAGVGEPEAEEGMRGDGEVDSEPPTQAIGGADPDSEDDSSQRGMND